MFFIVFKLFCSFSLYCFKDERDTATTEHVASEPSGEAFAQFEWHLTVETINGNQQRLVAAVDGAAGCSWLADGEGPSGQQQHPQALADHTFRH